MLQIEYLKLAKGIDHLPSEVADQIVGSVLDR